jgi:hypothetical protein
MEELGPGSSASSWTWREARCGYRPSNPISDGKWHKLKVKLVPPKGLPPLRVYAVYAKTGYYANSE